MRRPLVLALVPLALALAWSAPAPGRASVPGWQWPLPPPHDVSRGFDPPDQPWLPGHRGVDLSGRAREPVLAAGAGTVAFAGRVARVPVVSVRHPDGLLTTYQPVVASVDVGDVLDAGDRIGRLVADGSHCAPDACLHWGLRRGDDYLDPLLLVMPTRVRLIPVSRAGR